MRFVNTNLFVYNNNLIGSDHNVHIFRKRMRRSNDCWVLGSLADADLMKH